MDRRELLKRTSVAGAGLALGASVPRVSLAQDGETLQVWDTLNAPPRSEIIEQLGASFQESHSGVTVEHRGWATEELGETLPRSIDSDQGPAISQVNNGETLMGPMIRAGQIVSLQQYAGQYGWNERLPEGLQARNRYSGDGTEFGTGQLWGVSAESEIVGFYYNKQVFSDNGISVPTTFAEFEAIMAQLREAGQEPLVFGNLDGWQAIHLLGEIHGTMTTREYLDALIYRRGTVGFDDPSIVNAAAKVTEWRDSGYFMEGFEGITGDESAPLFATGVGAILLHGSWAAGIVGEGLGDQAGFFLMPPREGGAATPASGAATPVAGAGPVLHVGGVGIPYSITINAANPDLAAEFINHLVSDESFNLFIDAGLLPAGEIPRDRIQTGTLPGDLYTGWNSALAMDGIGHYMDWAAPGFYDVIVAALQELLGGQVEPEAFATTLQEFYAASFEG